MENVKTQRTLWIDQLRGLAIILVVIGHLIQFNGLGTDNPVFEIIYTFHMPLFFAISGCVAEKTTHIQTFRSFLKFEKKKIIAIGFPWIIWGLVISKCVFTSEWPTYSISEVISFLKNGGLWFLGDLLCLSIIYGVHKWIYDILQNHFVLSLIVPFAVTIIIMLGTIFLHIRSVNILLWTFSFYTGVLLARYNKLFAFCLKKSIVTFSLLIFVTFAGHWNFIGTAIDDLYKLICSTCAIIIFSYFFVRQGDIINTKVSKMFTLFGNYSLCIYVIQFYIASLFTPKLNIYITYDININPIVLFLITFAIAIIICYVCTWIAKYIKCFPLLDLLLLGNHRIKLFATKQE